MHFIVLFGVIAKLAFVSGSCDVGTLDLSVFDITKFSGVWHWQYHNWNEYDDEIVCPAITFSDTTSTTSRVTTSAFDRSTHRRVSFSGFAINLDNKGYISYNDSSMWSGRFNVLASDPERYSIALFCSERLKKTFIYVATRRECPDEATLRDVDRALMRYNLRIRQLVKWCNIC